MLSIRISHCQICKLCWGEHRRALVSGAAGKRLKITDIKGSDPLNPEWGVEKLMDRSKAADATNGDCYHSAGTEGAVLEIFLRDRSQVQKIQMLRQNNRPGKPSRNLDLETRPPDRVWRVVCASRGREGAQGGRVWRGRVVRAVWYRLRWAPARQRQVQPDRLRLQPRPRRQQGRHHADRRPQARRIHGLMRDLRRRWK